MIGTIILLILAALLLVISRRYAPLVFLTAALLIPMSAGVLGGGLSLYPLRLMVLSGIVRLLLRGERPIAFPQSPDWMALAFGPVFVFTSFFHKDPHASFINAGALTLDYIGTYFLFRCWIREWDDVGRLGKFVICIMVPLAMEMLVEKLSAQNLFGWIDGSFGVEVREGSVRAKGPFLHPILAGTVATVSLPWAIALWREHRRLAVVGIASITAIAFSCASSGPLLALQGSIFAVCLWRYRRHARKIFWVGLCLIIGLHVVMKAPVWYLMARIDLTGSSTGWHRAELFDAAVRYFDEWWFAGTDYTRHWMPTGVSWNPDHTDLTNNYINLGVMGGLPLLLLFIGLLRASFRQISTALRMLPDGSMEAFQVWCLGACLFSHCFVMMSVAYFDQSSAVIFSLAGVIASVPAVLVASSRRQEIEQQSAGPAFADLGPVLAHPEQAMQHY